MLNLFSIAVLQAASIFFGAPVQTATPIANQDAVTLSIEGGSGGWTGDIAAVEGGSGGWTGDITAVEGGSGGWTGDIAAVEGGSGGWTGDIA